MTYMIVFKVDKTAYVMSGSDGWNALMHAIGVVFLEIQQLEFSIISFLSELTDNSEKSDHTFDLFASKTFGNLLRAMENNKYLEIQAKELASVKLSRDHFIHKFLFHKYGGLFTTDEDYESLIKEASNLSTLFANAHRTFNDHVLKNAPLAMFAVKRDAITGEFVFVESAFSKKDLPS